MMKAKTKRLLGGLFFLILLVAFVLRAGYVLMPERTEYGAVWNMYLKEPENSIDILYFGSSMAYCDVVPAVIYERTGLTGFVMAGPEQTLSVTYYYVREALKTQSPSVIFLEIGGMMFGRYTSFTKANVGYMPYFSLNRVEATLFAAEDKEKTGLFFPLFNYHDRFTGFSELFCSRPDEKLDPFAGATLMTSSTPQSAPEPRKYNTTDEMFEENTGWLNKIIRLCDERNIKLVLFEIPSCGYIPDEWFARISAAAGESVQIVNFNEQFETMGLDTETDFYDFLHTNVSGAVKFSRALSDYIEKNCEVVRHSHDDALWQLRQTSLAEKLAELS